MNIPQYITQLTKEWLRDVSKRLVAGNCIRIRENSDNREVSVDIDALKTQIETGGGTGTVNSVDSISPDSTGNVALNALTDDDIGVEVCSQSSYDTLDGYVETVEESVEGLADIVDGIVADYVTSSDLSGYATQTWVGQQGFLTDADLSGYATTTALTNGLADKANSTHTHSKSDLTDFDSNVDARIPQCYRSTPVAYTGVDSSMVMMYVSGTVAYGDLSELYAEKNHTHDGYAASNHTHDGYATSSSVTTLSGSVEMLAGIVDGIVADYVTSSGLSGYATQTWVGQQGFLTDADLSGYALSSDLTALDTEVGTISDSVSELCDTVETIDEDLATVETWKDKGVASSTIKVVTGVTWNGTTLQYTYKNITVTNGLITNVPASSSTTTVDTPAVITWS